MKIICATDFSERSMEATRVAARLARRFGDDLVLVHAWTSPFLLYREIITDPMKVEERLIGRATADLTAAAQALRTDGLTVETRLVQSADPAEALTTLGKDLAARMIVVGTRHGHNTARLFIGSTAERTMLLADRPVLVVHPGSAAVEEWANGRRPLRLVVGLDRSAASLAALGWVRSLRALGPCDVVFVHAFWPIAQYARLGLGGPIDLAAADAETRRVLTRELSPLFADLPGSGHVELRLEAVWGSPAEPLLAAATAAEADLLLLGTSQKGPLARLWSGATVQPTVRLARIPVLCVPAPEAAEPVTLPRPQLRNILVATDFSPLGDRAVAYAYELARNGGTVALCHVHEGLTALVDGAVDPHAGLGEKQRNDMIARLRALIPPDATGVPTTVSVLEGTHATTAIIQEANRLGVDAICLGSHGRSGLSRAVMGSVAETVARDARRPVLIIRPVE
jgi:nucleotide-binding universal stress UspA family protein